MAFTHRPAIREKTPMIVGLAGPSKSGKTYSALRLASGMADGGRIIMINTEGARGRQYADDFKYEEIEFNEPFSMKRYEEAIKYAASLNPAALIIDSMSHAHEGLGGMLLQHEAELDRMAGTNYDKRQKMTWAAWVKPKEDEANMINTMLQVGCHIIACFRAKEKMKLIKGKDPENLGWQPIASDRMSFETAFTLVLPPHSEGTPDIAASEFRKPYNTIITGKQLDEAMGAKLAEWAKGGTKKLSEKDQKLSELADLWKKLTKARKEELKKVYPKSFAEYDMETLDKIEEGINACLAEAANG